MAVSAKFEVPEKLAAEQLSLVEKVKKQGKLRLGVNEVTKAVERGTAKLVLIALDVDPAEIVMHLPELCLEKGIAYSYVAAKKDLGEKAGLNVGTAAIAIVDAKDAGKELGELQEKIGKISK